MLQIIILIMCFYLVLKGKEFQFIAASSTHENREENLESAIFWSRMCYAAAVVFVVISFVQSSETTSRLSQFQ